LVKYRQDKRQEVLDMKVKIPFINHIKDFIRSLPPNC